jgi:hypothetical protein
MEQPRKFGFGSEADSGDQRADVGYGSAADVVAIISVACYLLVSAASPPPT